MTIVGFEYIRPEEEVEEEEVKERQSENDENKYILYMHIYM